MNGYQLLDSGDNEKLERFGDIILRRPSKFSIWNRRRSELWRDAHGSYDHKKGWSYRGDSFEEWEVSLENFLLKLRLQQNGQIGLFPEHLLYQSEVTSFLKRSEGERPRVLNLFAYTGLASVIAAKEGAFVTHVDIAKQVIRWAKENAARNSLPDDSVRYIQEDALAFLKREATRGNRYDLVIADPPAFSRVSSNESWDLEEVIMPLLHAIKNVLSGHGALIITTHRFELGEGVLSNLIHDCFNDEITVDEKTLFLKEEGSPRKLPSGFLAIATL